MRVGRCSRIAPRSSRLSYQLCPLGSASLLKVPSINWYNLLLRFPEYNLTGLPSSFVRFRRRSARSGTALVGYVIAPALSSSDGIAPSLV